MAQVQVVSRIPKVTKEVQERIERVVRQTALFVEAGAKVRAPVDTGFLRNSIQSWPVGSLHSVVNVGAEYGFFVEMGTHRMAARPYLYPAALAAKPIMMKLVKAAIGGIR